MRILILLLLSVLIGACQEQVVSDEQATQMIEFETIDTDFSKGRLNHVMRHNLDDLEKFHGHLCDGLVLGALAMQEAMRVLYPNQPIDRTNLRIVSKPSPCLTDVAVYMTGGRYQFNTFYVDLDFDGIYIIQRIDDLKTVRVSLNPGIKPAAIDSLGNLAVEQKLAACDLDVLRQLEDEFTRFLLESNPHEIFTIEQLNAFEWNPILRHDFLKTDVLNKRLEACRHSF